MIRQHPRINCPECRLLMVPFTCRDIVVDKCENCNGIWFDNKELGIFRDSLKELPIETIEVSMTPANDTYVISTCPRCRVLLSEERQSYNSTVKVQKCKRCKGVWLSQVELLRFIDLARIAKVTEPEVKGLLKEWTKVEKDKQNWKEKLPQFSVTRFLIFGLTPIPLYDENPRKNRPWVTVVLIVFCLISFYFTSSLKNFSDLGVVPGHLQFSALVTSLFLHGNLSHLLGNMFFLWTFGDNIENKIGPSKYVLFFLFCGIIASFTHIVLNRGSLIPVIGASGAISGIMGAYLYLFPKTNLKTWIAGHIVDIPVWIYLLFWFVIQLLSTLIMANLTTDRSGVAFGAHVGGFAVGYLLFWLSEKFTWKAFFPGPL